MSLNRFSGTYTLFGVWMPDSTCGILWFQTAKNRRAPDNEQVEIRNATSSGE